MKMKREKLTTLLYNIIFIFVKCKNYFNNIILLSFRITKAFYNLEHRSLDIAVNI